MAKTYDPKCWELAKHFYPNAPEEVLADMAGDFQDVAEDYTDLPVPKGDAFETLQEREDRIMFEPREG